MTTTQNLTIALDDQGNITVTPDSLELNEGGTVQITVTRPENSAIYGALLFDKSSSDQDPFNSTTGGVTNFSLAQNVASTTLTVANNATAQSDSYSVILSASQIFIKDPIIVVDL